MAKATHPKIKEAFACALRPLTTEESDSLEAAIVSEGAVRDPIDVWDGWVADGHHRLKFAKKHNVPYATRPLLKKDFAKEEDVILWIVANQLARRNLNPTQVKYLQGKQINATPGKQGAQKEETKAKTKKAKVESIATEMGVSVSSAKKYAKDAKMVDNLNTSLKEAYLAKKIKLTAAELKALSSLSKNAQHKVEADVVKGSSWAVALGLAAAVKAKKPPSKPKAVIDPQAVVDCFKRLVKHVDEFHVTHPNEESWKSIQASIAAAYKEFDKWMKKT